MSCVRFSELVDTTLTLCSFGKLIKRGITRGVRCEEGFCEESWFVYAESITQGFKSKVDTKLA